MPSEEPEIPEIIESIAESFGRQEVLPLGKYITREDFILESNEIEIDFPVGTKFRLVLNDATHIVIEIGGVRIRLDKKLVKHFRVTEED